MDVMREMVVLRELREIREIREMRENRLLRRRKTYKIRANPMEDLNDDEFFKNYRFSKQRVQYIIELVRGDIEPISTKGGSISPEVQTFITLRYYAKGMYQQDLADIHGVSRATVCRCIKKVSFALVRKRANFIKFPPQLEDVKRDFYNIAGMPNIVGAIDGTLIKIIIRVSFPKCPSCKRCQVQDNRYCCTLERKRT